jgi:hypothetical protein
MTFLAETAWSGPEAEDVVASIAEEFATCSGEYPGKWGGDAVVVTSEPLDMDVPGAAASVCRYYEMTTTDEGWDTFGPMCVAASGDRVVSLLGVMLDDTVSLTPDEYGDVMAAAAAKVFAG